MNRIPDHGVRVVGWDDQDDWMPPKGKGVMGWLFGALALGSMVWLFVLALGARSHYNRMTHNGYFVDYRWDDSMGVTLMFMLVISALASFTLIVASFCLWPKENATGRTLTITAAILFLPYLLILTRI